MSETMHILQNFPIFSELNDDERRHLTTITTNRTYDKRQYIFMEGDDREAVYFINKGIIKTFKVDEDGNEQVINVLQKEEMFPHVGFFDTTPYPATAEVMAQADLLVIRNDDFENLMIHHPTIAIKVMRIMGEKIYALAQRVQEMISQDVRHRITLMLLRLANESGEKTAHGIYINIPLTNRDFANMIGSSRETINRVFNELKKENILQMDRHGILIRDAELLKNYKIHR